MPIGIIQTSPFCLVPFASYQILALHVVVVGVFLIFFARGRNKYEGDELTPGQ